MNNSTSSEFEKIRISPAIWPGKTPRIQPGDLSQFSPRGNGAYGYQKNIWEPIKGAPIHEKTGCIINFGNNIKKKDFLIFLRMMNIHPNLKDYAAFIQESSNPIEERYFKQMRFVSKFGLRFLFGVLNDRGYETFDPQELNLGDALWEFMEIERERFGTFFGDPKIDGKMGGDGDYAIEELSFGFMLENEYHGIYRIWSRAWLVTK
ncbi:MAG: hypothetical protein EU548_05155 [Promethearchaeota archaeon]|nr:MAG: hypothetical protein EU548_05155 [Candidatus Lokiarchaeota archaeon]